MIPGWMDHHHNHRHLKRCRHVLLAQLDTEPPAKSGRQGEGTPPRRAPSSVMKLTHQPQPADNSRPSGLRGRPANETYDAGLSLDVDRRIADNFVYSPRLGKHRHMA